MANYIYGAGGHGKVVLEAMQTKNLTCAAFVDDSRATAMWIGLPVQRLSTIKLNDARIHLAIGDNASRMILAASLGDINFFSIKHISAIVASSATIGDGALIAANTVLGPDATVGNHCIINHSAVVDHDCSVANFSHVAPNATLSGGVKLGKSVLIGAGAVILPNIEVGDNAIVGAGAVVTSNIPAGEIVVGVPAKTIN